MGGVVGRLAACQSYTSTHSKVYNIIIESFRCLGLSSAVVVCSISPTHDKVKKDPLFLEYQLFRELFVRYSKFVIFIALFFLCYFHTFLPLGLVCCVLACYRIHRWNTQNRADPCKFSPNFRKLRTFLEAKAVQTPYTTEMITFAWVLCPVPDQRRLISIELALKDFASTCYCYCILRLAKWLKSIPE